MGKLDDDHYMVSRAAAQALSQLADVDGEISRVLIVWLNRAKNSAIPFTGEKKSLCMFQVKR